MTTKILDIVPTLQATALVGENVKFVKKKKKTTSDFAKVGIKNIVGIELTKATANLI